MNNYKEMGNQIYYNEIIHFSAIYIRDMNITRSLCKTLMIKSVLFTPGRFYSAANVSILPFYLLSEQVSTATNIGVTRHCILQWL